MDKTKIKAGIDLLKDGQPFKLGDVTLEIENEIMYVIGWTRYLNVDNLTREIALSELKEIKDLFERMMQYSLELKSFTVDKVVEIRPEI